MLISRAVRWHTPQPEPDQHTCRTASSVKPLSAMALQDPQVCRTCSTGLSAVTVMFAFIIALSLQSATRHCRVAWHVKSECGHASRAPTSACNTPSLEHNTLPAQRGYTSWHYTTPSTAAVQCSDKHSYLENANSIGRRSRNGL